MNQKLEKLVILAETDPTLLSGREISSLARELRVLDDKDRRKYKIAKYTANVVLFLILSVSILVGYAMYLPDEDEPEVINGCSEELYWNIRNNAETYRKMCKF